MEKRKKIILGRKADIWRTTVFLVILGTCCFDSYGRAELPDEVIQNDIALAAIKAVAKVEKVEIVDSRSYADYLMVTFRLEKAYAPNVPEVFKGYCYRATSDTPPLGTVYFYPEAGQSVYAVIDRDEGEIVSLTVFSDAERKIFLAAPQDYGWQDKE